MKLNKWLYGAMALGMLAACSDKDVAPGGDRNDEVKYVEGSSFLGISLELPSESSTRADDENPPIIPDNAGNQGNDNFADGTTTEYNVRNAAILLFQGETEDAAEFMGAYILGSDETFEEPKDDNITTSFQRTIQVLEKPVIADNSSVKIWGLALVNYNTDHFDIKSTVTDTQNYGKLTVKETTGGDIEIKRIKDKASAQGTEGEDGYVPSVKPTTFSEFRSIITTCKFINLRDNGSIRSFFMTNAPLSNVRGTTKQPQNATIQTLSVLDHSKFYSTKIDAMKYPAGCIFVERAVAKVTCSKFPKTTTLKRAVVNADGSVAGQDVVFTINKVEWLVDNIEPTSYIVRNAKQSHSWWEYASNNSTRFRFIGNANMYWNSENFGTNEDHEWYRTYWCEDPHYSTEKGYENLTDPTHNNYVGYQSFISSTYTNGETTENIFASGSALYPHENTFDIEHQNYKNTTRVLFKVTYGKNVTLKALKDENGNVIEGSQDEQHPNATIYAIRGQLNDLYLHNDAENILKRDVMTSNEVKEQIRASLAEGKSFASFKESDLVFTFATVTNENNLADSNNNIMIGDYVIASVTFNEKAYYSTTNTEGYLDPAQENEINEVLAAAATSSNQSNHLVPFSKDNDGNTICYYFINIQHFGDTYCALPTGWTGVTTDAVYGEKNDANEAKYLGRFGMVRNNWYDIIVDGIGKLGNANVPGGDVNTSDDNKEESWYLSARIHVLSWAKRTQHHSF